MADHVGPTTRLRELLAEGCHAVPGTFNAAVALLIERLGFPAVYASGAGIANGVAGVPDIGLLTLTEVARQAGYIAEAISLPVIADADTGFGEPLHVRRCVREFERAGVAGIHIEDQQSPKRCGHLAGKQLISPEAMARKIAAATEARRDPNFVIIARTDARGVLGLEDAIQRALLYREAGADVIFPEGLESAAEFAAFARAVPGPLLANMTEFGRTPYLSVAEFSRLGYRLVIFPMTAFRVMMKAVEEALRVLRASGTQQTLLDRMQTRQELYDLLRYDDYSRWDARGAGLRPGAGKEA
ncbi:MAG: methylisocitrate lyase [Armatimonadetes bacterium]|nr:methylisocitrate lyase [Armatimonadota bacterium]